MVLVFTPGINISLLKELRTFSCPLFYKHLTPDGVKFCFLLRLTDLFAMVAILSRALKSQTKFQPHFDEAELLKADRLFGQGRIDHIQVICSTRYSNSRLDEWGRKKTAKYMTTWLRLLNLRQRGSRVRLCLFWRQSSSQSRFFSVQPQL